MAITNYFVVAKRDPTAFAAAVKANIDAGYQPFGAPFMDDNNGCITQAMVEGSQILVGATGATGPAGNDGTSPGISAYVDPLSPTFAADLVAAMQAVNLVSASD